MDRYDEIEIDLIDLLCELIKKLPLIILVGFICAVLGAGIGACKSAKENANLVPKVIEEKNEEEEAFANLIEVQKNKMSVIEQQILENEKQIALQEKKLESNLIWNWNVPVAYRTTVKYLVVPTGDDETYNVLAILSAYQSAMNSADFDRQLVDVLGLNTDIDAVRDLVWSDISFQEELDGTPGTLSIQVRGKTEEDAKKMTGLATRYIDSLYKAYTLSIAKHDLKHIAEYDGIERLDWVENDKAACTLAISDKNRAIANLMEEKEKVLFPNGRKENTPQELVKKPLFNAKVTIIGAILGLLVAGMCITAKYVLDGVMHDASVLEMMTGVQCFYFVKEAEKKGLLTNLIRKIKSIGIKKKSIKDASGILIAFINAICKNEPVSICFVGSYIDECQKEVISEIKEKVSSDRIKVNIAENPLNMADAMNALALADFAVITEVEGQSRIKDVITTIDLCKQFEKKILNCFIESKND